MRSLISCCKASSEGLSRQEFMVVIAIITVLASIAIPSYFKQVNKARVVNAVGEIDTLQLVIIHYENNNQKLPGKLEDLDYGDLKDPWGNSYQYINVAKAGKNVRKDRFNKILNSDYDLYSAGRDGQSALSLTADQSHDDVVRARNGAYIGLASKYN